MKPADYSDDPVQFIAKGASPDDVTQGRLGDCWLVSALSVLAGRDDLITGGLKTRKNFRATKEDADKFSKGVYPPLFHIYRKKGIFVFRIFKEFKWMYVIVDERLPCENNRPVFGHCKNITENWVNLIEKAYAKLHGCYEALISGFIDDAMADLTGFVAEKIILFDKATGKFPHKNLGDKDKFWQYLLDRVKDKCLMGCSKLSTTGESFDPKTGIIGGHAYALLDAFEIPDPDMENPRKVHRIMKVRNPHGNGEWKGKWADVPMSDEMDNHSEAIDKYLESLPEDERIVIGENDGEFFMNYQSWREQYTNMFICIDFPDEWSGIRYFAQWDETCTGGLYNPFNDENCTRWANNP